jgi:hypothetical protein
MRIGLLLLRREAGDCLQDEPHHSRIRCCRAPPRRQILGLQAVIPLGFDPLQVGGDRAGKEPVRGRMSAPFSPRQAARIAPGPYAPMLLYLTGEGRHHTALLARAMTIIRADRPLRNRVRELGAVFTRVLGEHLRTL